MAMTFPPIKIGDTPGTVADGGDMVVRDIANTLNPKRDFGAIGDGSSHPASEYFSTLNDLQAKYPLATSLYQEIDFLAWEAALATGRPINSDQLHYIMCNTHPESWNNLTIISGLSWIEANGAQLDFGSRRPVVSNIHYLENPFFITTDNWQNATGYNQSQITPFVITGNGSAVYSDPASYCSGACTGSISGTTLTVVTNGDQPNISVGSPVFGTNVAAETIITALLTGTGNSGTYTVNNAQTVATEPMAFSSGHFGILGQNVTLQPGSYRAMATMLMTRGASYNYGDGNNPYARIFFYSDDSATSGNPIGIFSSDLPWTYDALNNNYLPFQNLVCDFTITQITTLYVCIITGGYANIELTYFDIIPQYVQNATLQYSTGWQNATIYSPSQLTPVTFIDGSTVNPNGNGSGYLQYTDPSSFSQDISGSIVGNTLTVDNIPGVQGAGNPNIQIGSPVFGNNVAAGTVVTALGTGTGSSGTYTVNNSQTVSDESMSFATNNFGQFGVEITLIPGNYLLSCTVTATKGASATFGNFNGPYAAIAFCDNGPGNGGSSQSLHVIPIDGILPASDDIDTTVTVQTVFNITEDYTTWVTFSCGGALNFKVSELSITPWLQDCGIYITRDGSPLHYPIMFPISGLTVTGPGNEVINLTGLIWNSMTDTDGNITSIQNTNVESWEVGIQYGIGAYLHYTQNVNVDGCAIGIQTIAGSSSNAGENMRWYGGGIFNNTIGIDNNQGMEFTFYGTAIDYNGQGIVNNSGRIELHGCHLECYGSSIVGRPLYECEYGGRITMFGGFILVAPGSQGVGGAAEAPIWLTSILSQFICYGTIIYNLNWSGGTSIVGPGSFQIYGLYNTGNPNFAPIITPSIGYDVFAGSGKFEPSNTVFGQPSPSGVNLLGGLFPFAGNGNTITITDNWTNNIGVATISTDYAHSGTQSLKITKTGDAGQNVQLVILAPVTQGRYITGNMWFLFPDNMTGGNLNGGGPNATIVIYYRLFFCQVLGYDKNGLAIINGGAVGFTGEFDMFVPAVGSNSWIQQPLSSLYLNDQYTSTEGTTPGAPAYATHYAIVIDTENLPPCSFYIDDLVGNYIG
jgi:hypothetical protein